MTFGVHHIFIPYHHVLISVVVGAPSSSRLLLFFQIEYELLLHSFDSDEGAASQCLFPKPILQVSLNCETSRPGSYLKNSLQAVSDPEHGGLTVLC